MSLNCSYFLELELGLGFWLGLGLGFWLGLGFGLGFGLGLGLVLAFYAKNSIILKKNAFLF